ncbi:unnamed protein product [Moneuplotes crassus]|uniref:Uncharacterized protein n=1 Tax=Euplotes crassus TaxID=5936 RepID=A0AAD1X811_EUPCR|nr:unnamed protein product [Moneuplotes crassus]
MLIKRRIQDNIFPHLRRQNKTVTKTKVEAFPRHPEKFDETSHKMNIIKTIREDWNSLNKKYGQHNSNTRRLLKYYVEKVCETSLELLRMDEKELALSMLKNTEEDLPSSEMEYSYYKYKINYNIAHICSECNRTKACIKYLTRALVCAEECNITSNDKLHFFVSSSRMQEIFYNRAKAYQSLLKYKEAEKDILASIALAHKSCEENTQICEKLVQKQENYCRLYDQTQGRFTRISSQEEIREAMKMANKQWESSIAFLISAQWTKSETLEARGMKNESIKNYESLLNYLDSALTEENQNSLQVTKTKDRLKELLNPTPKFPKTIVIMKSKPKNKLGKRSKTASKNKTVRLSASQRSSAKPTSLNKVLICPHFVNKQEARNNTEEQAEFYGNLIKEIKNKAPIRMNLNEYILYIRDKLNEDDCGPSEFSQTKNLSAKLNKSAMGNIPEMGDLDRLDSKGFKQIYQGSYRDIELDVLYRLVCGLAQSDISEFEEEKKEYEIVKIILHNVSMKNRVPKEYVYEASELFPDLLGEWMSYNEVEMSNELRARLERLVGHTDIDFTNKDAIIKTHTNSKPEESNQIIFMNMNDAAPEQSKANDKDHNEERKVRLMNKATFQDKLKRSEFGPKEGKHNNGDISESYEASDDSDREPQFIEGVGNAGFKEFKPDAVLTDEDRKIKDKVRDAGYKIPKYDIIRDYKKMQKHFLDDEATHFDENKKIAKYAQIFMKASSFTPAQAAALFQCRYKLKLLREEKRRKEMMEGSTIGFFVRKYYCNFRCKKDDPDNTNHLYVKYIVKRSLKEERIIIYSKDFTLHKEKNLLIESQDLPEEDPDIIDCCKAWIQVKVTGHSDYMLLLDEDQVPEHEPLSLVNSAPPQFALFKSGVTLKRDNSAEGDTKFMNIEKEELKETHTAQTALSKMFSSQPISLAIEGDNENPLHKDINNSEDTQKVKQSILIDSDKKQRSILFIQAMIRAHLKFGKRRNATKRRQIRYQNKREVNLQALCKAQKLIRRFLMRKNQQFINKKKESEKNHILTKVKRMDDNHYYIFKVFCKVQIKEGQKRTLLKFDAIQKPGDKSLSYRYLLPNYSLNKQYLVKVCDSIIEHCLFINEQGEIKLDAGIYKTHCTKLLQENEIIFMKANHQKEFLVPSLFNQLKAMIKIQRVVRGYLSRKNKPTSKVQKSIIYQSCVRIEGSLFFLKLQEMKVKETQKHYFLYVQNKSPNSSSDEQKKFEFKADQIKYFDFENLDILFKHYTKIDLLDDEDLQIDWEGFKERMELKEEFEQEFEMKENAWD